MLDPDTDATFASLLEVATGTLAHVTLHATFGAEATRHPMPDWTCQIAWSATTGVTPAAFFGSGATPEEAAAHVLQQIKDAYPQDDDTPPDTQETP